MSGEQDQFSIPTAAGLSGIPESTLYDWVAKGKVRVDMTVLAGRNYYTIRKGELLRITSSLKSDRYAVGGRPGRRPADKTHRKE